MSGVEVREVREVMHFVRNRCGDHWAEWPGEWEDIISALTGRMKEQRVIHPGFDVVRVIVDAHVVVAAGVTATVTEVKP